MEKVSIGEIRAEEITQAAEMLGKVFATNPNSLAVYGDKPDIARRLSFAFVVILKQIPGQVYVARQGTQVVGAMRIVKWPKCQTSPVQGLSMLPVMLRAGPGLGGLKRGFKLRRAWTKQDPKKPHWHLDPLGVAPDLQGKGIGSQLMAFYCNRIDNEKMDAYHETDRAKNVPFYQRFGFEVIGEEKILGATNWYMWRNAKL
jgi:ribosomal protein S18 acetylase RimI-like enzyme